MMVKSFKYIVVSEYVSAAGVWDGCGPRMIHLLPRVEAKFPSPDCIVDILHFSQMEMHGPALITRPPQMTLQLGPLGQ